MLLKSKMMSGQKIYGTMLRLIQNPAVCYIAKNSGLDFVMYDCEHASYDMQTLHQLFITGNALGLNSFLRVPELSKDYISRSLDQGAHGVMVPMIETVEMAKKLVNYAKYQPVGNRGFAGGIAHVDYIMGGKKHVEIMEQANNTVIAIAQIETKQAVDQADEIAALPGIDALLIGPNDLSLSLGIPGDLFNPIELEAISHVASACQKRNKAFGLHAGPKLIEKFIDDLSLVMMQSDIEVLTAGFTHIRETCENLSK